MVGDSRSFYHFEGHESQIYVSFTSIRCEMLVIYYFSGERWLEIREFTFLYHFRSLGVNKWGHSRSKYKIYDNDFATYAFISYIDLYDCDVLTLTTVLHIFKDGLLHTKGHLSLLKVHLRSLKVIICLFSLLLSESASWKISHTFLFLSFFEL